MERDNISSKEVWSLRNDCMMRLIQHISVAQFMGTWRNPHIAMNMPIPNEHMWQNYMPRAQTMGALIEDCAITGNAQQHPVSGQKACKTQGSSDALKVNRNSQSKIDDLHNCVAVDCENYKIKGVSSLGRVSIVDHEGNILLDTFVRHDFPPTDYLTKHSGIRPENLIGAPYFWDVQMWVAEILQGKIVVGHDLVHDFNVLHLHHPIEAIRDTSTHQGLKDLVGSRKRGKIALKELALCVFGEVIQTGEHCSVVDSRMAMRLFRKVYKMWHNYGVTHHRWKTNCG